jgi:hypothetical protein
MPPADKQILWTQPPAATKGKTNLDELLTGLGLKAAEGESTNEGFEKEWNGATPASMQLITAGVTNMTKRGAQLVAGAGDVTGFVAIISGYIAGVSTDLGPGVTSALIGSGALILAASAIALAMFVSGDLEARGRAAAAQYVARGEVAAAFLRASTVAPSGTR